MKILALRPAIVAVLAAAAVTAPGAFAQANNRPLQAVANLDGYSQLDAHKTLFMVLAAINAAGYDADIDSPTNHPLRKAVRDRLASQNIPALSALRRYVRDQRPASGDPAEELSQYISFALLSKGPPDFTPLRPAYPQPREAAKLFELPPLLADVYKQANLEALWAQALPYYQQALSEYIEPLAQTTLQTNAYLRAQTSGFRGRRFFVFLELLGAPNQVQTRTYLDDYIVVVTPSAASRIDEIRRHYLNYSADVYPIRYAEKMERLKPLQDFALGAPLLSEQYKSNFTELATASWIRALEARILRRPELADQAAAEGFVLAPVFLDALKGYDAQERQMNLYFPELLDSIDLKLASAKLEKIEFATERSVKTVRVTVEVKPPELTGLAKTFEDAENLLRERKVDEAKALFEQALASTAEKPQQAKATYGLARVAILNRDPETGDRLFRRVLELDPDAHDKSWSLLYLGKLWDSQGETETALGFYRQALAVEGLPDQVRREAEQGVQGAFRRGENRSTPNDQNR